LIGDAVVGVERVLDCLKGVILSERDDGYLRSQEVA
jgi:hypothetical protein